MTNKEVTKRVRTLVYEGKSQQEIFDTIINDSFVNSDELATVIRRNPSLEIRKKYRIPFWLLIGIFFANALLRVIQISTNLIVGKIDEVIFGFFSLLILFFLIRGLLYYKRAAYVITIIIFCCMLITLLFGNVGLRFYVTLIYGVVSIFITATLLVGLFPNYDKQKELFINQDGVKKLRYVYTFNK